MVQRDDPLAPAVEPGLFFLPFTKPGAEISTGKQRQARAWRFGESS